MVKRISKEASIVDLASEHDIIFIDKSGTWYSYGGNRLGQGRENAKQYLKDHPDVALDIETKVRSNSLLHPVETLKLPRKKKQNNVKKIIKYSYEETFLSLI